MLIMAFFQWWYGPGWRDNAARIASRVQTLYLGFSLPILARTMFAPWRRIVTRSNGSLQQKIRAGVDNLLSRVIGLIMRVSILIFALLAITLTVTAGLILMLVWPFLPVLGPVLIVMGLVR